MRKRRHRTLSVETEIKQRAAQIQRDQMSEAMKAAALIIVGRKLDEIKVLLQSAGIGSVGANGNGVRISAHPSEAMVGAGTGVGNVVVQHPCSYCGRESVYRTKPHRFNRTGTWLCQAHYPLRRQHESASTASPPVDMEPEQVGRQPSQAIVNGGPALPPDKPDTGGDVGIADAFAAVGIQTNAQ